MTRENDRSVQDGYLMYGKVTQQAIQSQIEVEKDNVYSYIIKKLRDLLHPNAKNLIDRNLTNSNLNLRSIFDNIVEHNKNLTDSFNKNDYKIYIDDNNKKNIYKEK